MASLLRCMLCVLFLRAAVEAQDPPAVPDPDPVIVEAPSEIENEFDGYNERKQGSVAFACTELDAASPWLAYAALQSYISEGNDEGIDLSEEVVLYPLQEYYGADTSAGLYLCLYLQREHHCYPPKPTTSLDVRVKKFFEPVFYYAVRYWGQSSSARTDYYHGKLTTALGGADKSYDQTYFILSYYPNHVREVRVDATEEEEVAAPPPEDEGSTPPEEGSGSLRDDVSGSTYDVVDPCLEAPEEEGLGDSMVTEFSSLSSGGTITVSTQTPSPCHRLEYYTASMTTKDSMRVDLWLDTSNPVITLTAEEVCNLGQLDIEAVDATGNTYGSTSLSGITIKGNNVEVSRTLPWQEKDACIAPLSYPPTSNYDNAVAACGRLDATLYNGAPALGEFFTKSSDVNPHGGWVGLTYKPANLRWEWLDGSGVGSGIFKDGTDFSGATLHCAYLDTDSPKLVPAYCNSEKSVVCMG